MAQEQMIFSVSEANNFIKALLDAVPIPDITNRRERTLIKGEITSPIDPPDACRFATRCDVASEACSAACPKLIDVGGGHLVRCFNCGQGGK